MIRFSCSWSHLGRRWMSSWGTITVGAWRAQNIYLNSCWIWGKFSIKRRSLSTLRLFHYHRRLSQQKEYIALKLLFTHSFCACMPKSPFLDDKDQNILSGKSEYVRKKGTNQISKWFHLTGANGGKMRAIMFCLLLQGDEMQGTSIEMKWNEMQGATIDSRLCFP